MRRKMIPTGFGMHRSRERGFTLAEVLVATVILISAIVAVAKLVPLAIGLNAGNRRDSTALVIAQRELNQMIGQPLTATTFVDAQGFNCNLGNAATPNVVVGSPVVVSNNRPIINFGVAQVAGYSFNYQDPNDPSGMTYDVRWAVITSAAGGNVAFKRFILGARRQGGNAPFQPVTIDTMVQK